ncbi:LysM and putative peptidoglycan-binding domain-containing protein [Quillaja saponaria]|uniref:LysM and putative peptidoglycan-binding domain-containing protein n=1 Tax=Quillaja saponaria TaxID=32244 RepID=A0AAD7PGA8_QUISA|nr:LysM and putative peptidoglycan-binding domain-containing protein [Quillaja saponaria]
MQMERERWNVNNGNYGQFYADYDDVLDREVPNREQSPTMSFLPISSSPISSSSSGVNYIEHPVSKLDTLAGVAIKYGVEVADIKKMNRLVTDLQMFALKSLHIPLPGRHPPSPCLSNGSDTAGNTSSHQTPDQLNRDLLGSFQSLRMKAPSGNISPAMSSLQGFYGLEPPDQKTASEECEMAVYTKGSSHAVEDGPFPGTLLRSNPPLSRHRKSRSLVNAFLDENGEVSDPLPIAEAREVDSNKWNDKLVRRRQKSETDFTSRTPELLLKEDNNSCGGFSSITGRGLALRLKATSRTSLPSDAEASGLNPLSVGSDDSFVTDWQSGVRKSSSTSSLHDQENGSSSSIWSTWSLKPDLQAFSTTAIAKPIFDGLPKPITSRRNKTALD